MTTISKIKMCWNEFKSFIDLALKHLRFLWIFIDLTLKCLSCLWLFIGTYTQLHDKNFAFGYYNYLLCSAILGAIWTSIKFYYSNEINISYNQSTICIKYGDIFKQQGVKAIGANDFFDTIVDDKIISRNSLHGQVLNKYWLNPNNIEDFKRQKRKALATIPPIDQKRSYGTGKRYPIGTTFEALSNDNNIFLFVALSETNIDTNVTSVNLENFIIAIKKLLNQARISCANKELNIPLMGSGLGRVKLNYNMIINIILILITDEIDNQKITEKINIILPKDKKNKIDLMSIKSLWT